MKRILSVIIAFVLSVSIIFTPSSAAPAWNGDANGDGQITLTDVSTILKHIAKWDVDIDPIADFDTNGKINLNDAAMVLKHIAKWNVAPDTLLEAQYGVTAVDFEIPEPAPAETVKGSDFGFDTEASDNYAAWVAAVTYLKGHPGTTLEIEKGVYKMASGKAVSLDGLKNCVIDCGGSTFSYSKGNYFNISGGTDLLTIKNLTVDWDRETAGFPSNSVVRIKDIKETDDPAKMKVDYEFLLEEDASYALNISWSSLIHMDPDTLTMGIVNGNGTMHTIVGKCTDLELTAPNVITATTDADMGESLAVGELWLMRHAIYTNPVFRQTAATNVTYKDITVYSGPGGAIYITGENNHHVRIDGVTVGLNPETANVTRMSTTADALNFKNTGGYIIVENCDVGFQGDDCINVHSTPGMVNYAYDNVLEVILRNGVNFYAGCEVGFKSATSFDEDSFTATVTEMTRFNNDVYYITLDKDVPDYITDSDQYDWMVYNKSNNGGNIIIRNNYFHEAHSHGIVLRCSDALVENNRFYRLWYGAINVSLDYGYLWIEGTGLENVIIRNNVFDECDLLEDNGQLAFLCKTDLSQFKPIMGAPFKNVLISGNTFINPKDIAIEIRNADNVSVVNNRILNPDPLKLYSGKQEYFTDRGRIVFGNSFITNATVIHNTWEKSPYIPEDINEITGSSYVNNKEKTIYGNNIVETTK